MTILAASRNMFSVIGDLPVSSCMAAFTSICDFLSHFHNYYELLFMFMDKFPMSRVLLIRITAGRGRTLPTKRQSWCITSYVTVKKSMFR